MRLRHPSSNTERGQIMILFALMSFVLVGMLALALDVGYLMTERRQAQAAADAGALAGAVRLMSGDGESAASADALSYVEANDIDLSLGAGPTGSVAFTGDSSNGTVTVDVTVPVTKFFVGALYTGNWEVSARAVADINDNKDAKAAVIALEEPGMSVHGAPQVKIIGGGAFSNGDIARSGQANGFYVDTMLEAVGSVDEGKLWTAEEGFYDDRPVLIDPLLNIPPPTPPDTVIEQATVDLCMVSPPSDCVLPPGYYKDLGVIEIGRTATLTPGGLYYFENTAILLRSTNSRIDGEGVMLYFAEGTSSSTTYFDPANSSAGGVHLTAPATSPYVGGLDGMTLWIDNCSEFDGQGAGEFYIKGVFYAPCSRVLLHGNPYGEAINGQIIVGTLEIYGTSEFVVVYEEYVRIPRLSVSLIE